MLYSILIALMALILPFVGVFIYRMGNTSTDGESLPRAPKIRRMRGRIERDRLDDILDNIDAYDGTGANQRDVI